MQFGACFGFLILPFLLAPLALSAGAGPTTSAGAQPRVTVSLSGNWEFLPEHAEEQIQNGDSYTWGSLLVPALWGNAKNIDPSFSTGKNDVEDKKKLNEVKYCWYRRKFKVDGGLKGLNCLVRIVDVRWSAEVWLNGARLGRHVGAYRPVEFDATNAIRPGEENSLIIKNGGGRTIPKYEDGTPSIPFGHKGWARGASGIMGDIELRFFRDVAISCVKIDPDIRNEASQARVRLTNHSQEAQKVTVLIRAHERRSRRAASDIYEALATLDPGSTTEVSQIIKIGKPHLWSPEDSFLYYLDITVKSEDQICDHIQERFGMREFQAKNGGFFLNGKRIFLRGATDLAITGFPSWGTPATILTDPKWIKKYLVDDARGMNARCFRTHMGPWYRAYYDIADEHGQMIISEFPNWPPEGGKEYYHRPGFVEKLHSEMELIAEEVWNHPSVIIWAGCNEPYIWNYDEDEKKYLEPFFRKLDPRRPMMRAGAISEAIGDQHGYEGFWVGTIGDFVHSAERLKQACPNKPVCDTEYLETSPKAFSNPDWGRAQKWMGYNVSLERAEFTHALFAMEQTETKRRMQFDGLLPFWYAMFVSKGEKLGDEKWLTYYSLKNALAPVALSIGLFDRHFATGSDLKLQVWTMNDLEKKAKGRMTVYLVREDPPYVYAAPPASPLFAKKMDVDIAPYSSTPHELVVPLPKEEGSYWLYATLQVKGREAVISKRPVHVLDRKASISPAKGASIAVIEQGSVVRDWARSAGIDVKPAEEFDYQTLVVGREALGSEAVSSQMRKIDEWVRSGGRLVILDQKTWPEGLFGLQVEHARSNISYVFKEKGRENDPVWHGIADAHMENWNGSRAEGLVDRFKKPVAGEMLAIGSGGQGGLNSPALVRLEVGKGEVLACQIRIAERLAEGTPMFDPVAERLMANLIAARQGRREDRGFRQ